MMCTNCGGTQFETTYEDCYLSPHHLPNVILTGIRKDICLDCGEYEIEYPHHNRLLEVVAIALLNKNRLLAPGEIRWLRSRLGLTAVQFASFMKVSSTSISYWENGQRSPSPLADLALRLLVMFTLPKGAFSPEAAPEISAKSSAPLQLRLHFNGSDWVSTESESMLIDPGAKETLWGSWPRPVAD